MQGLLLRFLETGEIEKVGADHVGKATRVRIMAATNRNLGELMARGQFREDLFYRINVIHLVVTPLRERREDIPLLVNHFLGTMADRDGVNPRAITPEAVQALSALEWPGNVRELRNTIERLIILSSGPRITLADVERLAGPRPADDGSGLGSLAACATFEAFKAQAERAFLLGKLRTFDWNVSETARALDMPRSNLYKKIERYGLTREN
jgi:two-component system, NtrC family, nitrogen regulation response regulator NtrX